MINRFILLFSILLLTSCTVNRYYFVSMNDNNTLIISAEVPKDFDLTSDAKVSVIP